MSLTFENPSWLLLALLVIPVVFSGLAWFTAAMSRPRALSAIILRSILIALIASMLAGAAAVRTSDRVAVIAVVDVSDSVRQFAQINPDLGRGPNAVIDAARNWIDSAAQDQSRRADDLLGVVVFDGASIATATPRPRAGSASSSDVRTKTELDFRLVEGTNIEAALRYAAALFPPDARRRLVLISDGSETEGSALAAATDLGSKSTTGAAIPIDVVPIAYEVHNEIMIENVDTPPSAASKATILVRVVLRTTDRASGRLELLYDGKPLDINGSAPGTGRHLELSPPRHIERIEVKLTGATVHRFEPRFIPDSPDVDRVSVNNTAEAFTITPGKGSVLVVDGVGDARTDSPGRTLANTLAQAQMEVQTISAADVPTDLLSLQAYDAVILEDIAADDLPEPTHQLLADYVAQLGGGLVMVGGPDSFGAGGWNGTALEPILPVKLDLPEEMIVPSAALVIIIDNSGSMGWPVLGGSRSQQDIANEGAAMAIRMLDARDMVCVIAFNSTYTTVIPMQRNTDAQANAQRVRGISSGGGTEMYTPLGEAYRQLAQGDAARAKVRHVILLTDGQSMGNPEHGYELARKMNTAGISVSTISVGDSADQSTLEHIAEAGGGRFYPVVDPNTLPRIFIRDVRVVRKPLLRETPFRAVNLHTGSAIAFGLPDRLPTLGGLVLTRPREDPLINLPLVTPEGDPLLAHWFVGRGQVAAFTSDAHYWAQQWLSWDGYASMWTRLVRTIARPAAKHTSELTTEIEGDQLRIILNTTDDSGKPLDRLTVPGTVFTPDHKRIEVTLDQIGAGQYQTHIPASARGNYVVALFPRMGDAALPSVVGAATRAVGTEYQRLKSNVTLLKRIAETTGGRVHDLADPASADLFTRDGVQPVRAALPLWPILLWWSIAVMLLDIATRRIAWDRLLTRDVIHQIKEQAASAVEARSQRAAATVATLRKVSDRVEEKTRPQSAVPKPTRKESSRSPGNNRIKGQKEEDRAAMRAQVLKRLGKRPGTDSPSPQSTPKPAQKDSAKKDHQPGAPVQRTTPPTRSTVNPSSSNQPPQGAESKRTTSGLLDAKRRARERFQRDDDKEKDD